MQIAMARRDAVIRVPCVVVGQCDVEDVLPMHPCRQAKAAAGAPFAQPRITERGIAGRQTIQRKDDAVGRFALPRRVEIGAGVRQRAGRSGSARQRGGGGPICEPAEAPHGAASKTTGRSVGIRSHRHPRTLAGKDPASSAGPGAASQSGIALDWIRLTPAAVMSFQAAASESFRSIARVASSIT